MMARASLSYTVKTCLLMLYISIAVHHNVFWFLWRPEEGVGSPELEFEVVVNVRSIILSLPQVLAQVILGTV